LQARRSPRRFEVGDHCVEKARGLTARHYAMVEGQRQRQNAMQSRAHKRQRKPQYWYSAAVCWSAAAISAAHGRSTRVLSMPGTLGQRSISELPMTLRSSSGLVSRRGCVVIAPLRLIGIVVPAISGRPTQRHCCKWFGNSRSRMPGGTSSGRVRKHWQRTPNRFEIFPLLTSARLAASSAAAGRSAATPATADRSVRLPAEDGHYGPGSVVDDRSVPCRAGRDDSVAHCPPTSVNRRPFLSTLTS